MVRIKGQTKRTAALAGTGAPRAKQRDDCSSGSCRTSSDAEEESEGSLADFIEHDSDEGNGDDSYHDDDDSSDANESDDEQVTRPRKRTRRLLSDEEDDQEEGDMEEATTEEDADEAIKRQYTPDMETTCGSVITDTGVRRSMRSNKGRAPVRYVDDSYAELMLEDVGSEDRDALAQELTDDEDEQVSEAGASFGDESEDSLA